MALSPAQIAHGPMLIGTVLNVLLYGITIAQIYLYHTSHSRDGRGIQSFVYLLFVGDTVHTIFTVLYLYDSLILNFGNTSYLVTANWMFSTDPALTGILGGLVQAFFSWRVKVLTGSLIVSSFIFLCAAASFLMGIATAVAIGIVPRFVEFQKFKIVVIIWLGASSFADIVITLSLVIYLKRHRTGFVRTDTCIDRIIRLTVQTGLITALWAFVDLLVYLLNPTGLHLVFNFPLSKLYTNSLMSSLNARTFWQYDLDDDLALNTEGLGARGRGGRRRNTDSNHHNLNSRTGSTEDTSLSMSTPEACSVNATVTTERTTDAAAPEKTLPVHLHGLDLSPLDYALTSPTDERGVDGIV